MTHAHTSIDPTKTALVLADFQPVILSGLPDAAPVIERATAALAWARENDVQVVHVRVAFKPEDYAAIPSHNKAFAGLVGGGFLADGAPETQVHEALTVVEGDIVVRKIRFGAFSTTGLYADLHAQGVDTLVIGGISTGGVVLSTVRDAADADYRLFVLSDACADPDADVHRVLTEKVFPHQADVIAVADLVTLVQA